MPIRRSCILVVATFAATVLAATLALSCSRATPPAAANAHPAAAAPAGTAASEVAEDGIPWFRGTVEEAFAAAKRERKPVFLYWGAVWCPPCHALRSKIFPRPEIRARLAATIPVYLDGDTERAQIWGEKLGTQGYPTVIVFAADGRELTRLPSMLPVDEYADVLTRALDAARPIRDVLDAARRDGLAALPPNELELLAFYSWDQDDRLGLDDAARRALFARFRAETPADRPAERARFLALELAAIADADTPPALAPEERAELAGGLTSLLAERAQCEGNLDLVLYRAGALVPRLAPEPGAERDALVGAWAAAARRLEDDASLSVDERLNALLPQLELAVLDAPRAADGGAPPAPPALRERVRDRIRKASAEVADAGELQAVMDTMVGLLEQAGLPDEAERLLAERLGATAAPYYYVGYLASLEAKRGQAADAVAHYREAWQLARRDAGSAGAAMTPFRWGSRYLVQAMKLTPAAASAIGEDAHVIVGDLVASPDAFSGGNWSRLQGLATAFESWQADARTARAPVFDAVRAQVAAACAGRAEDGADSAGARCRSFGSQAPKS